MDADTELRQQEMERDNLQRIVSALETAIAVSSPASRANLERTLHGAKAHLFVVEKKITDTKAEIEHQKQEAQSIGERLAAKEWKLNADEQRNFAGFLKEDFFKKKDFKRLEDFYTKTWDRLSDHGKDEMSTRIWEGVRHGEYTFGELPEAVREREAKRAYGALIKQENKSVGADSVEERDRRDFIRAYDAGKTEEADKILERQSFKKSMFQSQESASRVHAEATIDLNTTKTVATNLTVAKAEPKSQPVPAGGNQADQDFSALGLKEMKLVETDVQGTSADIPSGRTAGRGKTPSTPGG